MYIIIGVKPIINLLWVFLAYIASLLIVLSPIGELFLRISNKARKIKRPDYLEKIMPIFNSCYEKAKMKSPFINKNIKIYLTKSPYINAFAIGRRTIIITSAALEIENDILYGILAHEFGHIANRDTDFLLLAMIGNFFFFPVFFVLNFGAGIISSLLGYPKSLLGKVIYWILTLPQRIWTGLGSLLILKSGRSAEFKADNYSASLGYKDGLLCFLKEISKLEPDPGFLGMLKSSHPASDDRIAKLMEIA
jgi:heat shock protein HtpX